MYLFKLFLLIRLGCFDIWRQRFPQQHFMGLQNLESNKS